MINLTSKTSSSENCCDTKLQSKFDESDQNFEQREELMDLMEQQHLESKQI